MLFVNKSKTLSIAQCDLSFKRQVLFWAFLISSTGLAFGQNPGQRDFNITSISAYDQYGQNANGVSNGLSWQICDTYFSSCCGANSDGSYNGFNTPDFSPPVASEDAVHISLDLAIVFDRPVDDIVFYLREDGGTASFDFGMTPIVISGAANLTIVGTRIYPNTLGGAVKFENVNARTIYLDGGDADGMNVAFYVESVATGPITTPTCPSENTPPDCSAAAIADQLVNMNCEAIISSAMVSGVTDADNDPLTIEVSPSVLSLGSNEVQVTADDGHDGSCSQVIEVFVLDVDGDEDGYFFCQGDCSDEDPAIYPDAEELCNGVDDDCDGTIDEGCGGGCNLTVSLPTCRTVYRGYAPAASTTLTTDVMGGNGSTTYSWSNGATTPSITVNPTTTMTYSVTVSNGENCSATAAALVEVVDVRCGNNNNKVQVCHNGTNTLCVAPSAVPAHLAHGDALGACGMQACDPYLPGAGQSIQQPKSHHHEAAALEIFPNPATNQITVMLPDLENDVELKVENSLGITVLRSKLMAGTRRHTLDVSSLPLGLYSVSMGESEAVQFVKQ